MGIIDRFLGWRASLLADPGFQDWAASFPLTRPIARRRARDVFDLTAGFVYSQVLFACVELNVLGVLRGQALTVSALSAKTGLPEAGTERLARAAASIRLLEKRGMGYGIGPHGAALLGNPAVFSMIKHHAALYKDLADPIGLLRGRSKETELAKFWDYSQGGAAEYSELMADTQSFIAAEILKAYSFKSHARLADVGGGAGAFLCAAKRMHPHLEVTLCDLPNVAALARAKFAEAGIDGDAVACNFLTDTLPTHADIITLIRVLHDHDDDVVRRLLSSVFQALPNGGTLLVAEPMADTPGAAPMGEAYFGMYLWAMGAGRPRSSGEIRKLLAEAGFAGAKIVKTRRPILTQIVAARKTQ